MLMPMPMTEIKRLSATSAGLRMSPEEFQSIEDFEDGYRYELIDGVVVVTPPASDSEVSSNEILGYLLVRYRDDHPQGSCLDDTLYEREVRTLSCIRRTDRSIWIGLGRAPDSKQDVPTIIVEFVSPGRAAFYRDYVDKRDEYLKVGCHEYWVVDRFDRTMTVFRPSAEPLIITEEQLFTTPLLPGFELPLKKLFAASDRYKK
jgi:Uma2 family endonuclease